MDPLSATANCITIIALAYKSCQSLSDLFRGYAGAPKELSRTCAAVKSLATILAHIATLHNECRKEYTFSADFRDCLETCTTDVVSVERKLTKMDASLRRGKLCQSWTKFKWSSSVDQWLGRFFNRVQTYHVVISLELVALQLSTRATNAASTIVSTDNENSRDSSSGWRQGLQQNFPDVPEDAACDSMGSGTLIVHNESVATARSVSNLGSHQAHKLQADPVSLTRFLQSYVEPFAIRTATIRNYKMLQVFLSFWQGSIIEKRWSEAGGAVYKPSTECTSYALGFTARSRYLPRYAFTLKIFIQRKVDIPRSAFMKWDLSFSSVVPTNAAVMELAKQGDVGNMKGIFVAGKAAFTDTTSCGVAAREGQANMVSFLLECGADPNSADQDGETALHVAIARSKDYDVCRMLIESGADLCNLDVAGKTPTHTLYSNNLGRVITCHREPFQMALQDDDGMTSLHYAAWSAQSSVDVIKLLIQSDPASLHMKDNWGRTFLFLAVERGNDAIVGYILHQTVRPDLCSTDNNGLGLLHYATRNSRVRIIESLCKCGCDPHITDHRGQSPLHHATRRGNIEAVKILLSLMSPNASIVEDKRSQTPMSLALIHGHKAIAELLQSSLPKSLTTSHMTHTKGSISENQDSQRLFSPQRSTLQDHFRKLVKRYTSFRCLILLMVLVLSAYSCLSCMLS